MRKLKSLLILKPYCKKIRVLPAHRAHQKLVGPGYKEVMAKKYKAEQILELIASPKPANWPGYPPMAALPNIPKDEALKIANWIVSLAPKKKYTLFFPI